MSSSRTKSKVKTVKVRVKKGMKYVRLTHSRTGILVEGQEYVIREVDYRRLSNVLEKATKPGAAAKTKTRWKTRSMSSPENK